MSDLELTIEDLKKAEHHLKEARERRERILDINGVEGRILSTLRRAGMMTRSCYEFYEIWGESGCHERD